MEKRATDTLLDYVAAPSTGKHFFSNAIPLVIVFVSAAIVLGYLLYYWVPHRQEIFRDFHMILPGVSTCVIDFAGIVREPLLAIIFAGSTFGAPFVIGVHLAQIEDESRRRRIRRNVIWALVLLTIIAAGFIYVAISEPMWGLIDSLKGP